MARDSGMALGSLIAAKIVCCGGLALAYTGMLSGVGAWLTGSGYLWAGGLAGVLLLGAALLHQRRARRRHRRCDRWSHEGGCGVLRCGV